MDLNKTKEITKSKFVRTGSVFVQRRLTSGLRCHPDKYEELLLNNTDSLVLKKIITDNVAFLRSGKGLALLIAMEKGNTFEYYRCDFLRKIYVYVDVTHYQILINEKTYWQSYKSDEEFLETWEML